MADAPRQKRWSDSLSTQYALLDTQVDPIGKLVIFLPGANNSPGDWRNHGRKLAFFGFHVLIPHYNNRWSSNGTCDGQGNGCSLDTRWEALTGEDASAAIVITRADSVEGRVLAMLIKLRDSHPPTMANLTASPAAGSQQTCLA